MKFHASHFTSLADSGEKALLAGVAGGRVRYDPQAVWLYSVRFFFLWYRWEILWTTGEEYACQECKAIPIHADDGSLAREIKQEGAESRSS